MILSKSQGCRASSGGLLTGNFLKDINYFGDKNILLKYTYGDDK